MMRDTKVLTFSSGTWRCGPASASPYLYALFHKHLGVSPHQYLLNYRLRLARIRLAGSDDNIKTISEECGFENLESFYRAFRRTSGMPPGEYRRAAAAERLKHCRSGTKKGRTGGRARFS